MGNEGATADALRFSFVDVFASEPLSGNPLAVVQAAALPLVTMQRIAREFNQSETTFILAPRSQDADWRLRSFTATGTEVFGAGHNALGAWWWLAECGKLRTSKPTGLFRQEIGNRVLPVEIEFTDGGRPLSVTMTQSEPALGLIIDDLGKLARALTLAGDDFASGRLPVQVVSTGAAHLLVPLNDCDTVDRVHANSDKLLSVLQSVQGQGCYVFSTDVRSIGTNAYARFFNPTVGIWEDPATGSAAGPLACHLTAHGITQRNSTIVIEQGAAMGRRSLIHARVTDRAVQISGAGVVVAEGVLKLNAISEDGLQ